MTIRKLLGLFVIMILIVMSGCSSKNNMPDEMPKEFDFKVKFGVGSKNEINTFDKTVTKDLVEGGTITEKIPLTLEELEMLYEKVKETNVLERKKLEPNNKSCLQTPYREDKWEINVNDETITFYVSEEYCNPTNDAKKLIELRNDIVEIVSNKEKYKKLPEPIGAYM